MKHDIDRSELKSDDHETRKVSRLKRCLRKKFLPHLNDMCKSKVRKVSRIICARLAALPELKNVRYAAVYAAMGNEIDLSEFTLKVARNDITLCYPKFNREKLEYELVAVSGPGEKLVKGYMGVPEPKTNREILDTKKNYQDLLWLIPGIAFDKKGSRLGRGMGYYDRLLKDTKSIKIGVAYDWQVIDRVPVSSEDVSMDYVITETRHLDCFNRRAC